MDQTQLIALLRALKAAKEERMYPRIKALEAQLWAWLEKQPEPKPLPKH